MSVHTRDLRRLEGKELIKGRMANTVHVLARRRVNKCHAY